MMAISKQNTKPMNFRRWKNRKTFMMAMMAVSKQIQNQQISGDGKIEKISVPMY